MCVVVCVSRISVVCCLRFLTPTYREPIYGHKCILAARSKYFRNMFLGPMEVCFRYLRPTLPYLGENSEDGFRFWRWPSDLSRHSWIHLHKQDSSGYVPSFIV